MVIGLTGDRHHRIPKTVFTYFTLDTYSSSVERCSMIIGISGASELANRAYSSRFNVPSPQAHWTCRPMRPPWGQWIGLTAGITYQPNTVAALAEALEKLLTDEKMMVSCSSRALHLSKTRYNDELTAHQLLKTYNLILEEDKNSTKE